MITGIVPDETFSPAVTAFWLLWENLPDEEWTVRPGATLAVTEVPRVVAYLTVERVSTGDGFTAP